MTTTITVTTLDRLAYAGEGEWTPDVARAADAAAISAHNAILEVGHEIDERADVDAWVHVLETTLEMLEYVHDHTAYSGDLIMATCGAEDLLVWIETRFADAVREIGLEDDEGARCVAVNCRTAIYGVARARALQVGEAVE